MVRSLGWGLAFAAFLYLGNECSRPPAPDVYTEAGKEKIVARGDELRATLERYRSRVGRYPRSLRQIEDSFRWDDRGYGGWSYRTNDGGKSYYLSAGGYVRYGFVLYRTSGAIEWSWDT